MSEQETDVRREAMVKRALGYGAVLAMLLVTMPVPTAWLLAKMVQAVGLGVDITLAGTWVTVGEAPARAVTFAWTAAPTAWLGMTIILAANAPEAKKFVGMMLLTFNALLVDLLFLGMIATAPPIAVSPLANALQWAFPVLMVLVLVVTLLYWFKRVLPEHFDRKQKMEEFRRASHG